MAEFRVVRCRTRAECCAPRAGLSHQCLHLRPADRLQIPSHLRSHTRLSARTVTARQQSPAQRPSSRTRQPGDSVRPVREGVQQRLHSRKNFQALGDLQRKQSLRLMAACAAWAGPGRRSFRYQEAAAATQGWRRRVRLRASEAFLSQNSIIDCATRGRCGIASATLRPSLRQRWTKRWTETVRRRLSQCCRGLRVARRGFRQSVSVEMRMRTLVLENRQCDEEVRASVVLQE